MINDTDKIQITNLTAHRVGFNCSNFPVRYIFNGGQTLKVRFDHLLDAAYSRGVEYMLRNGYLRINTNNDNYDEIMGELRLDDIKEIIEHSLSLEDAKKLLRITPIQTVYAKLKKELKEGTETTKENIKLAAIELNIRDYTLNKMIKDATGTDVIKTLELNSKEELVKEE